MLKNKNPLVNIAVLIGVGTAATSFAAEDERKDAQETAAVVAAMISLTRAITAAEQHTDGKAIKADFDNADGQYLFEIEIAKDQSVQRVFVDADSGRIVADREISTGNKVQ